MQLQCYCSNYILTPAFTVYHTSMICRYPDKMPRDKMPQSQKRTKCHNVDGEIRMQQKCYKGVTWFDKDVAKVL